MSWLWVKGEEQKSSGAPGEDSMKFLRTQIYSQKGYDKPAPEFGGLVCPGRLLL